MGNRLQTRKTMATRRTTTTQRRRSQQTRNDRTERRRSASTSRERDARRSGDGRRRTQRDEARSSRGTRQQRNSRGQRSASPQRDSQGQAKQASARVGGIDGFRAIAVIAVLLYHLDVVWLPSGHLGVIMFLVLTGYLVTSSLLRRMQQGGAAAIPNFWIDRFLRIWPPMAVSIAGTILVCVAANHVLLTKARPDVLPGLAFFENISYILRNVSYFEQIGGPSPLTHLWYLGIDAQFCLVFPVLMLICGAILPSRATTRRLCLVLAVASAMAMGFLYNPDSGITRVYYGPDTRAFAPLIGAWLAYVMPLGKRAARDVRDLVEESRLVIEIGALIALVLLVIAMVFLPDTSIFLYRGGMFLAALLSAIILAAIVQPKGLLSQVLSFPVLTWLGSRSFGVYLWHYPLIQLFRAADNGAAWWRIVLVVLLSLLLAELTHQLIEKPIARMLKGEPAPEPVFPQLRIAALVAIAGVLIADGIGMAIIPDETLVPEDAIVSTGEAADKAMDLSEGPANRPDSAEESEDVPAADAVLRESAKDRKAGIYNPVLIGDSVPGDAAAFWWAACPDSLMDSYVGRRPDQALSVLNDYLAQGVVGDVVILQAFSNIPATYDELEQMVAACGPDRSIYLVSVRIPESEEAQINQSLHDCADRHENVKLIDWYAASEGMSDWLYPDGEHLTPTGQPEYVSILVEAIIDDFEASGGTVVRRGEDTQGEGAGQMVVVDPTAG